MMIQTKLSRAIIVILLICNAITLYLYFTAKHTDGECQLCKTYQRDINTLKQNMFYNMMTNNVDLSKLSISNSHREEMLLEDLFGSEDSVIVICRIPKECCPTHNVNTIMHTRSLDGVRTICLTNDVSRRGFKNVKDTYGLPDEEIFGCNSIDMKADRLATPYIIVAKDNGRQAQIIFPISGSSELIAELIHATMKIKNESLSHQ